MSSGVIVLLFGGFVALVVVFAVLGAIATKKRREAFRGFAASRGWTYAERDDRWGTHFDGHPFDEGHDRRSSNVMTGLYDGRGCLVFDYVFHTTETSTNAQGHTTRREVSHDFSITAIDAGAVFPKLRVTPEGFFTRFVGRIFNKDIELESEEFNRAFTVSCEDRKFASDVLHPRMMELLLTHRDLGWTFNGSWILSYDAGQHELLDVEPKLAALDGVLDNIPEFVWREVKGPST
jgi:hypothetical protein